MEKVPIIILAKERPQMLKAMIESIEAVTDPMTYRITIVDNGSVCPILKEYLKMLEGRHQVVYNGHNYGFSGFAYGMIDVTEDFFITSDPDIQLNPNMPSDWVLRFKDVLTSQPDLPKIGTALNITFSVSNKMTENVIGWETKFWVHKVDLNPIIEEPAYSANIDTTLGMYRSKEYKNPNGTTGFWAQPSIPAIRVAGNYTAEHLGWCPYGTYDDEVLFYSKNASLTMATYTNFFVNNVLFVRN